MSKLPPTPGPWHVAVSDDFDIEIHSADDTHVCRFVEGVFMADAMLMASAPTLKRLLVEAREALVAQAAGRTADLQPLLADIDQALRQK